MKKLPPSAYGLLMSFDGYGASKSACGNINLLYQTLVELPKLIGMRPVGFPHIIHVDEAGIAGLSGFTFIMESHISIHTYEERGFVTADVYSCKHFDHETAAKFLAERFDITLFETSQIVRGRRFHASPIPTQGHALDPAVLSKSV